MFIVRDPYIGVRYTYCCGFCNVKESENFVQGTQQELRRPVIPSGWRNLEGRWVCPAHKITTSVDGKEVL